MTKIDRRIQVKVPPDFYEQVAKAAAAEEQTVSEFVRTAVIAKLPQGIAKPRSYKMYKYRNNRRTSS